MKCPHCRENYHDQTEEIPIGIDIDGGWVIFSSSCPACKRLVLHLAKGRPAKSGGKFSGLIFNPLEGDNLGTLVYPQIPSSRPPCPIEVPKTLADDYTEACIVLNDSPKASAALSRRCLQHLLHEHLKIKERDLATEIQKLLDSKQLPTYIADAVDAIRHIGNYAAHPIKSQSTGEIVPVAPGEAEWNLDVLESLFDFYFVQPAALAKKRAALDQKLTDSGKKPMK